MTQVYNFIPEAEGDEALYLEKLLSSLDDDQKSKFSNVYRSRRKDPQTILITCILGLFLVAGIHRILLNQVGMGILYIFTGGLCVIGTIVDLVNYKDLTFQFNRKVAQEVRNLI